MTKMMFVGALAAMAAAVTASAEDFPLSFHTIAAKDVAAFPGGYGTMTQLRPTKPARVTREPRAVSQHPLYGDSSQAATGAGFLLRLDESRGDGKGYDQLIVDMNQNGDLTDDTPAPLVVLPVDRKASTQASRPKLFGPIPASAGKRIAGGSPAYYAQVYVNTTSSLLRLSQTSPSIYMGYARFKAGWYVDATVEIKGQKQKIGVFDGDSNLRLGDMPKPRTYGSGGEDANWYFPAADAWLIDADGSGTFDRDAFESESCAYGPILYFGANPYKVAVTSDAKFLRVEPWTEALAEVALAPRGEQVHSVTLAWEQSEDKWQLIRARAADGKIKVPPGNYRLYMCQLLGKGAPRDQVMVSAIQRVPKTHLSFAAGKANTLRCGAPLEIKVAANKRTPQTWELNAANRRDPPSASDSEYVLAINGSVRGGDGEIYSEFAKGETLEGDPPKPTFTVVDGNGTKVASGNLEFG